MPGDTLSVAQFGAVGDDVHDDAPAIQAAIDYALYVDGAPKRVLLSALRYRLDDTVHAGYGDRFVTLEIIGEPGLLAHDAYSGLYPSFNDRPCLNVQGGRSVRLRGLCIIGVNRDHLKSRYDHFDDRGARALWMGPKLKQVSDSRNAPYAGIAIDAYAGPPPQKAYPPVKYPGFLHSPKQYEKNFSSDTIVENCRIEGFCVALAVQPGNVPDASNGDFVTVRDCDFSFNLVGIADGHTDSRCNNVENSRLHFNHTAFDTVSYGPGAGSYIGRFSGCSFDNVWRILNINLGGSQTQGPYPLKFDGCYGESVYHLGTAYTSGSHAPGPSFDGCKFEFSIKNKEYSPNALLYCATGEVLFRNCVFQGGNGFARFDAAVRLDGITFSHPQAVVFDVRTLAGRRADAFTTEIWASSARGVRIAPIAFFDFSGRNIEFASTAGLDSAAFDINREADANSQGRPLPWWVDYLFDGLSVFPTGRTPNLILDRAQQAVGVSGSTGADYELRLPSAWLSVLAAKGLQADALFDAGDIVVDEDGGLIAYIVQAETTSAPGGGDVRLSVRQINAVRTPDYGKTWQVEHPMRGDKGRLLFFNARRFYPFALRATIETKKDSNEARLGAREDLSGETPFLLVEAGDAVLAKPFGAAPNERLFAPGKVVRVDRDSHIVKLDTAASREFWGDCPVFIKGRV